VGRHEDWADLTDKQFQRFVERDLDVIESEIEKEFKLVRAEIQSYVLQFREVLTNQRKDFERRLDSLELRQDAADGERNLIRAAVGVGRWLGPVVIAIIAIIIGRL